MKIFTKEQISKILDDHSKWLDDSDTGKRADLRGANLRDANLRGADLRDADLGGAVLSGAKTDQRFIMIGCIGSRKAVTTYCFDSDHIWCGCWSGSLDDFETRVKNVHADNPQYLTEYIGVINYIKSLKNPSNNEHPSTINHPGGREECL